MLLAGALLRGRVDGAGAVRAGFSWSGATAPRFDEAAQQRRARGFFFLRRKMGEGGELPGFAPRPPADSVSGNIHTAHGGEGGTRRKAGSA